MERCICMSKSYHALISDHVHIAYNPVQCHMSTSSLTLLVEFKICNDNGSLILDALLFVPAVSYPGPSTLRRSRPRDAISLVARIDFGSSFRKKVGHVDFCCHVERQTANTALQTESRSAVLLLKAS